jgi:hypothetical protein
MLPLGLWVVGGFGPFFEEINDEVDTSIAQEYFSVHVQVDLMEIRFEDLGGKVGDEMFSKRGCLAIPQTRLNRISMHQQTAGGGGMGTVRIND